MRHACFRLGWKKCTKAALACHLEGLVRVDFARDLKDASDVCHVVWWFDTRVRFTIFSVLVLVVPSLVCHGDWSVPCGAPLVFIC